MALHPTAKKMIRRGLSLSKSVASGEIIYSESPLVSSLFPDLENTGYCSCCMTSCDHLSKFCSETCEKSEQEMFGGQFLSTTSDDPSKPLTQSIRNATAFISLCQQTQTITPLLTAKFLSRMIYDETTGKVESIQDFSLWDHMDRLHYIDLEKPSVLEGSEIWFATSEEIKHESESLFKVFGSVPKFDRFLTEERYIILRGKFLYNAIAITTQTPPKTPAKTVESFKKSDQFHPIGVGLYQISSYLSHSCDPNVKFTFNGNRISLVALKDLKAGEELLVSFVDYKGVGVKARRRVLKEKYRFHCKCSKCCAKQ